MITQQLQVNQKVNEPSGFARLLKEHFEYKDGHLWWVKKSSPYSNIKVGQQFGSYDSEGYRQGGSKGKRYYEHRLIWLYHYGTWPEHQIDHINGVPDDNRIENLRECTIQQNSFNKKSLVGSTSKYKGVHWHKQRKKWVASYRYNGKQHHVGCYECEEEAAKAYREATEQLHKDFANYNKDRLSEAIRSPHSGSKGILGIRVA